MRWQGREKSRNIDDRRGRRGRGGPRFRMPRGRGGLSIIGIAAVIIVYLMGGNPQDLLNQIGLGTGMGGGGTSLPIPGMNQQRGMAYTPDQRAKREDELADFVGVVLKETEDAWGQIFREQLGKTYSEPTLVLFTDVVHSACGRAGASTGPFYCPADQQMYMDLKFSDDLQRMGGEGDFALAYVVAHEVGHHVQNLLGTLDRVHRDKQGKDKATQNALQVRVELQADFYAGVWAHYTQKMKNIIEEGDLEEALSAAQAVGDDRLQLSRRGYVVPESFTHGTSAQRMRWFKKGYKTGRIADGDTFSASTL